MRLANLTLIITMPWLGAALASCASRPVGFDAPDSAGQLAAIERALVTRDAAAAPELVRLLSSDDPVVRLVASRTLEDLTGQTMGYNHADPEWKRREAIQRWVAWTQTRPTATGSGNGRGETTNPNPGAQSADMKSADRDEAGDSARLGSTGSPTPDH